MGLVTTHKDQFKSVAGVRAYINNVDFESYEELDVTETSYIPIKESCLAELREATKEDRSMQELQRFILRGWPNEKTHLDLEIRAYFTFRGEITVQDGLIFRGNRVIVPSAQRQVMKEKIHSSHLGIEGCCRRACECVYWPGMSTDIKNFVLKCATCRTFEVSNPSEPLMPHSVPDLQ